jgi:hypothetical protein
MIYALTDFRFNCAARRGILYLEDASVSGIFSIFE